MHSNVKPLAKGAWEFLGSGEAWPFMKADGSYGMRQHRKTSPTKMRWCYALLRSVTSWDGKSSTITYQSSSLRVSDLWERHVSRAICYPFGLGYSDRGLSRGWIVEGSHLSGDLFGRRCFNCGRALAQQGHRDVLAHGASLELSREENLSHW